MDDKLLRHYERELRHLRDLGGEFASRYPKIAGRLGLETNECADPYVERLLEGFSFLAARIQHKMEAEFPRFTNHLLELIYPDYLAPLPAMAILRLTPDLSEGSLAAGYCVERGTAMHSLLGKDAQTACEFRTAHPVTLWPLELVSARYAPFAGDLGGVNLSRLGPVKAALRLRLQATAGLMCREIQLDHLPLYLAGSQSIPGKLLEHLLTHAVGMVAAPAQTAERLPWAEILPPGEIRHLGFSAEEALLPQGPRSFQGYRLLQEYFAFAPRFHCVDLGGLRLAMARCEGDQIDIVVLFRTFDPALEQGVGVENLQLFCTPAINLFPRHADRIHLAEQSAEHHVVPDRTRPQDFEVYRINSVKAYGAGAQFEQEFRSFYSANDLRPAGKPPGYFLARREQRRLSAQQIKQGPRSSYIGSETFISLVDASQAPYDHQLRQLSLDLLCTNRDLVLAMPLGLGNTDFTTESSAPLAAVRCVAGPSAPQPSYAEGETAWRLISHLTLNYLSLADTEGGEAATALRDMLRLYCMSGDLAAQAQINSVEAIATAPIVRRIPLAKPIAYGRGLQVTVTVDESGFEGSGIFLFGAVLEQFFAKYASINSFTEMQMKSLARAEALRWPPRIGLCATL